MSIPGLVFALLLVAAAVVWIASPFRRRTQTATDDVALQKRGERLLIYYERVLMNMRDLDEDLAMGKIAEADYQIEREDWAQRGIEALKAMDAMDQTAPRQQPADETTLDHEIDSAIEAAIAAYRHK